MSGTLPPERTMTRLPLRFPRRAKYQDPSFQKRYCGKEHSSAPAREETSRRSSLIRTLLVLLDAVDEPGLERVLCAEPEVIFPLSLDRPTTPVASFGQDVERLVL